jgi:hypothetical protein
MTGRIRVLAMAIPQPRVRPRGWLGVRQGLILGLSVLAAIAFAGCWYALGFAAVLPLLTRSPAWQ